MRTLLTVLVVGFLVQQAVSRDLLAGLARPLVLVVLHLCGIGAQDAGETMTVGRLVVPWTRDCSGANMAILLFAITVWMNRAEPFDRRYFTRLLVAIPCAILANVLRVLTLIGYRAAFYPVVESPQMHYFLGLAWLVPFIAMVLPQSGRPRVYLLVEAMHAAAVVALLTPMSGTPHGYIAILAAVLALAHCRVQKFTAAQGCWSMAWGAAGAGIALVGLESLWLPWLLVCPALQQVRWFLHPLHGLVIAATNPLFLMLPSADVVALGAIAWTAWQWFRQRDPLVIAPPGSRWCINSGLSLAAVAFSAPFLASTILYGSYAPLPPPPSLDARALGNGGYEVRLTGQPEAMGVLWYGPMSHDRHHTMKVCLKYRGIEIEPVSADSTICSDGQNWLYECFLQDHQLLATYPAYLRSTSTPGSSPGVHVIFIVPQKMMSVEHFEKSCHDLATQLVAQITTSPRAKQL